ncbi:surfactant protein C-like [Discoglossus pictus]
MSQDIAEKPAGQDKITKMESQSTVDLTNDPPAYKFLPNIPERKSKWIMLGTIATLLAVLIVGGCLIGVYMTQKHTEAVVEMVYNGQNGKEVQQIVVFSEKNNMAAFVINTQDNNATILYDFDSELIGIRIKNGEKCYVLKMSTINPPSLKEIQKGVEYFQAKKEPRDSELSFSFNQGEQADRKNLSSILNILCNDVPIYWGVSNNQKQSRQWSFGGGANYGAGGWQGSLSAGYHKNNMNFNAHAGYGPGSGWGGGLSFTYRF